MKPTIIYCPIKNDNVEMIDWGQNHAYARCSHCMQYPSTTDHIIIERGDFIEMLRIYYEMKERGNDADASAIGFSILDIVKHSNKKKIR